MLYKVFIRPFLFLLPPESAHHLSLFCLKVVFKIPFFRRLISSIYCINNKKLERQLFGLLFKNPVGLAAGFDKDAKVFNEFSSFGFGFIEIGTVTPLPQAGNVKPRLFRLREDQAIINRMGFNNEGVEKVVKRLRNKYTDIVIGGNIGKNKITPNEFADKDYLMCFKRIAPHVDYLVLNISSPNTPDLVELQNKSYLHNLLSKIQSLNLNKYKKPVLIKISPDLNFSQIDEVLELVNQFEIDGIIATNTTSNRNRLNTSKNIINHIGNGGLSGQPIYARSKSVVSYISKKTHGSLPIIAVGGIVKSEDAVEMLNAGASLVQIYTGLIYTGPTLVKEINKKLLEA